MRLWEYDEFGEPWLENGKQGNPPLLIVGNRPHKKGKKRMARSKYARRKSRTNRRGRKATSRRRRSKRNAWPMAGTVAAVNRPHRRGRKRSNRKRRSRKGFRRNPALLGISLPPLQSVLYVGVGFVGVPMVEGFLSRFLPINLTGSTIGKYATRVASVLGLSFLTKMVLGAGEAKMVAIGGGAYVLTTAVTEFAPGLIPATSLNAYVRRTQTGNLGAYKQATQRGLNAPAWGAQNTARFAGGGGANIVAQRFRRFQ